MSRMLLLQICYQYLLISVNSDTRSAQNTNFKNLVLAKVLLGFAVFIRSNSPGWIKQYRYVQGKYHHVRLQNPTHLPRMAIKPSLRLIRRNLFNLSNLYHHQVLCSKPVLVSSVLFSLLNHFYNFNFQSVYNK